MARSLALTEPPALGIWLAPLTMWGPWWAGPCPTQIPSHFLLALCPMMCHRRACLRVASVSLENHFQQEYLFLLWGWIWFLEIDKGQVWWMNGWSSWMILQRVTNDVRLAGNSSGFLVRIVVICYWRHFLKAGSKSIFEQQLHRLHYREWLLEVKNSLKMFSVQNFW